MNATCSAPSETRQDTRLVQDRRDFLSLMGRLGLGMAAGPVIWKLLQTTGVVDPSGVAYAAPLSTDYQEAMYYEPLDNGKVRCTLCPRHEVLEPGQRGLCLGRGNLDGRMVTEAYGQPSILNIDPVGKNPLANFLPELNLLSVAHAGCNLRCKYCQNYEYAFSSPSQSDTITPFDPEQTVARMAERDIHGVGFTYTEPAYSPEFVMEMADFCAAQGLKRTLCTAGFLNPEPFRALLRHFAAVTITFKRPSNAFYRDVCQGSLDPVLETMRIAREEGVWLEVATLIVPTLNDDENGLRSMAQWVASELGEDTPWHLERFDPQYRLQDLPPTDQRTLESAREIGFEAGLNYVYLSNLAPHVGNHTYCPNCGEVVVKRMGFLPLDNHVRDGRCPHCLTPIAGVWS